MQQAFEHPIQIQLHDTDAAGRVFFAHLFRHAHDAYEAFMSAIGHPLDALIRGGMRLPLTHAEADYHRAICHGDHVRVQTRVLELRRRSFSIGYHFLSEQGDSLARVRTVHVLIGENSTATPELPPALRDALEAHLVTD